MGRLRIIHLIGYLTTSASVAGVGEVHSTSLRRLTIVLVYTSCIYERLGRAELQAGGVTWNVDRCL